MSFVASEPAEYFLARFEGLRRGPQLLTSALKPGINREKESRQPGATRRKTADRLVADSGQLTLDAAADAMKEINPEKVEEDLAIY